MSIKVYFDLDGTLFDLYGQYDWLYRIENEIEGVFSKGDFLPELDVKKFKEVTTKLLSYGVEFGVITWLPMQASPEYEEICTKEKTEWVKKNLPFVKTICCQSYGIPKQNAIKTRAKIMYLIDDNKSVCETWETAKMRKAVNVSKIYTALDFLIELLNRIEGENGG